MRALAQLVESYGPLDNVPFDIFYEQYEYYAKFERYNIFKKLYFRFFESLFKHR